MPLWGVSLDRQVAEGYGNRILFLIQGPFHGIAAWRESGIKEPEQEIITAGRYEVLSSVPESLEEGATLVVELREVDTITQRVRPDQPPRETSK